MKAMTRKQLAIRADVTTKTLANWIEPYHDQLYAMGMRPYQILPPRVVEWLAHHYGIDVEDTPKSDSKL